MAANHKPNCNCENCAAAAACLDYSIGYAMQLESGVLKLYHLCKDGDQDNGAATWELVKTLARLATENDLRGYVTGLDNGMSAARAVMLRATNRLN